MRDVVRDPPQSAYSRPPGRAIQQRQQANLAAASGNLVCRLESDLRAQRVSGQIIGALRPGFADRPGIDRAHLRKGHHLDGALDGTRILDTEDLPPGAQAPQHMPIGHEAAGHVVKQEEWRPGAFGLQRQQAAILPALALAAQEDSQLRHRRMLQDFRCREVLSERPFDFKKEVRCHERIAAEVEIIVLGPDPLDVQDVGPQAGDPDLKVGSRFHIGRTKLHLAAPQLGPDRVLEQRVHIHDCGHD